MVNKFFLFGMILMAGLSKSWAVSVYDPVTNTITLGAGLNTLKSIYDDVHDPAALSYDSGFNTYTLSANISGQNAVDADLTLADTTLVINSTATPGILIKTWSDLTIQNMIVKAADPAYTWKIHVFARYTAYSLTITDSDFSGGNIGAAPNGYQIPSTPVVIKNNRFHDTDIESGDPIVSLWLNSANDAYLYNNTFVNCHIKSGQYNGIIGINTGIGTVIDKIYISSCSVNSYGMFYFFGAGSTTTPGRISNFEIKDCIGDGISGKEWGNVIITSGTITNVSGDGILLYHSVGFGMINWWVENVSINGAGGGICDNGADQLTAYLYNNKINNVGTAYRETYGAPECFYILNSSVKNYSKKYVIQSGAGTREMREYVLADIQVLDTNNQPIPQAKVLIEAIDPEVSDPVINRNFQPLSYSLTTANGHTPLPEEDRDKTIALLRYRKTFTQEKEGYAYRITAEKNGIRAAVSGIIPAENWYREDPNLYQNTITVILSLDQGNAFDLSIITVYPNPYVKGKNGGEKIFFAQLPKNSEISIYAISGELVKKIEHRDTVDGGQEEWDISNIRSGVYLYAVASSAGTMKGKVSIIK